MTRRRDVPDLPAAATGLENTFDLASTSTADLLVELGRRYRLRFGQLTATFHDGRPMPRVVVEHRVHEDLGS